MIQRLTLAEMAAVYRKTPKTFRKHVLASGIPHELIGRSMLFDPSEVKAYLTVKNTPKGLNVARFPSRKKLKKGDIAKSRFAVAAGL